MKPITYSFFKNGKQLKNDVKEDLFHDWKQAQFVTLLTKFIPKILIYVALALVITSYCYFDWYTALGAKSWSGTLTFFQKVFNWLMFTTKAQFLLWVILIVLLLLYMPLKYGCEYYFLVSAHNTKEMELKDAFCGFKKFFRILSIEISRYFLILFALIPLYVVTISKNLQYSKGLGLVLVIIGAFVFLLGYIRCIKTSMVLKVFIDNPDKKNDEIFKIGKDLMYKRRFAYLTMIISTLPLLLLSVLTVFIIRPRTLAFTESMKAFFYIDLL